jgi:hypothetical protein
VAERAIALRKRKPEMSAGANAYGKAFVNLVQIVEIQFSAGSLHDQAGLEFSEE